MITYGDANVDHLPTREGYDRWAAVYDDEDNPLIALEEEHLPPLLGDVRGLRVVDLGCGTGRQTARLAAVGADVVGVDFSEAMLARARQRPGAEGVRFMAHDLTATLPFDDGAFDCVVCCLVLEHIERLGPFFSQCRRICAPGGRLVMSAMHPAMMLRGITARFIDPQTGRETRPTSHPNNISDYVRAALRSGLELEHLSEHAVDAALARRCPRAEKYLGWPMLLLMGMKHG